MTDLTPEAVKDILENVSTISDIAWGIAVDMELHAALRTTTKEKALHIEERLEPLSFAPDLAREYLRLKKIEEAGKRLEDAADAVTPFIGYGAYVPDLDTEIVDALAAFRAAVEGE